MERWSGKIAVVTGASAGIGAATIKRLAENGIIVVGLARNVEAIKEISKNSTGTIHAIKCDLSNHNDTLEAFKWIETNLGGVDLLINNAGVAPASTLLEGTFENWKRTLDVNVLALSLCTKEALKSMRQRGDNGHIIHINSLAGHRVYPYPSLSMYTASKHAVTALAKSLRIELSALKSKIKVTNLCPGGVYTKMAADSLKAIYSSKMELTDNQIAENFLTVDDMADLVVNVISMKPHIQIEELLVQNISAGQN